MKREVADSQKRIVVVISPRFLRIVVSGDGEGPFVTVTHRITGQCLVGRPSPAISVAATQPRLARQLVAEFFVDTDYRCEIGRLEDNGRAGTFYRVVHLPTGQSRSADSFTTTSRHVTKDLLDALVEDLWNAGLLPRQSNARR